MRKMFGTITGALVLLIASISCASSYQQTDFAVMCKSFNGKFSPNGEVAFFRRSTKGLAFDACKDTIESYNTAFGFPRRDMQLDDNNNIIYVLKDHTCFHGTVCPSN